MSHFRIAAAQVASVFGDIDKNISTHLAAIRAAARYGINVLVFPELSLTGYEPELAENLAIEANDRRLIPLITLARELQIEIVAGAPLRFGAAKPGLGAVLISSHQITRTYCKMHLGGNEPDFFTPGDIPLSFSVNEQKIGIAICADASQTTHPKAYAASGATIYAAGVFLTSEWYETDAPRLASYAGQYRMLVVMANHAESVGTRNSTGKSAIWDPDGTLLAQAASVENALVIASYEHSQWSGEVVRI